MGLVVGVTCWNNFTTNNKPHVIVCVGSPRQCLLKSIISTTWLHICMGAIGLKYHYMLHIAKIRICGIGKVTFLACVRLPKEIPCSLWYHWIGLSKPFPEQCLFYSCVKYYGYINSKNTPTPSQKQSRSTWNYPIKAICQPQNELREVQSGIQESCRSHASKI